MAIYVLIDAKEPERREKATVPRLDMDEDFSNLRLPYR
jgi:hypothetical protein